MKYETVEIMPEVTLIRDKNTNIYVVESKTSALVIDTGYGLLNLKSKVEEITDKPVTAVVFTHGHNDHAFGGHYFDRVLMHKDEIPVFERHCDIRKPQIGKILAGEYNLSSEELDKWLEAKPEIDFISVGDIVDLGDVQLEVISLKGHTPGSIGLLDRKHRILFSGDGLNNHIWMQLAESSTLEEYLEVLNSTDRYLKDFDIICNGHSMEPLPLAFVDELKMTLSDLIGGAAGEPYNNPVASGMIYNRNGCEVVYAPDKIRKFNK